MDALGVALAPQPDPGVLTERFDGFAARRRENRRGPRGDCLMAICVTPAIPRKAVMARAAVRSMVFFMVIPFVMCCRSNRAWSPSGARAAQVAIEPCLGGTGLVGIA